MGFKYKMAMVIGLSLAVSACGQKTMYEWGGYNRALLNYAKNPNETHAFAESLSEAIAKAEAEGRVPPGLYAEYGYAVLETGDADTAIVYFAKERDTWPESEYFMDNVIRRLGGEPTDATTSSASD